MILTLQTSTFGAMGGIPTYNRLMCRVLNKFRGAREKEVLIGTDRPADIAKHAAEFASLSIYGFSSKKGAFARCVVRQVLAGRADFIIAGHVNYAPLALLLRGLRPQLRYGVMIYGVDVWSPLPFLRRLALQRADFVISISDYTRRKAVEVNGVDLERVNLLPNSLDWDTQADADNSPASMLPAGTTFLTVCRLDNYEKYKGVDTVIQALPAVLAQVPDAQYVIIGDGQDVARLRMLAEEKGVATRVHFLGFVSDEKLQACYRDCDLFVMPSAKEGFGFVFLEAMRHAKPVVAANAGGAPEVVFDEETGLLVPYGDVRALVRALVRLCVEPTLSARLGVAGYQHVRDCYTFQHFERNLNDILLRQIPKTSLYRTRRLEIATPLGDPRGEG